MAQLNVKPAGGQKLQLQRHTGANALTVDTHGNVQVAGTITTGTITNAVSVPQEVIKKMHHFTYGTRITGNAGTVNQFTWTTGFIPLDPANNQFHIHAAVPCEGRGQDFCGYGLRFEITTTNAIAAGYAAAPVVIDFMGKGVQYCDTPLVDRITMQQYNFVIGAGELPAGTFSIYHRTESDSSHCDYCPNTTDQGRFNPQTQAELMIIEYANI